MRQPTLGEFLDYLNEVAQWEGAIEAPVYMYPDTVWAPGDYIDLTTIYDNLVDELVEAERTDEGDES